MDISRYIVDVKDFPKKGINFKDITPILNNPKVFSFVIDEFSKHILNNDVDVIVAPEARGFLFASAVAYKTKTRFVIARKPNKLPRETTKIKYKYEYGETTLHVHTHDIKETDKVYIIDDVLATSETTLGLIKLIEKLKGNVVGISFIINIKELNGIDKLNAYSCKILI